MLTKKGFTLTELIAVIILLSLIVLISVPTIINTLKKSDQKGYENFEKALKNATELYVETNRDLYPELDTIGGQAIIDAEMLITENYLKSNVVNPDNNVSAKDYQITIKVGNDYIFEYTVMKK